ncbi:peptidoglycan-N-acetylmuramic acid deacetylase [Fontibacillus phaseoli]|uniref:Peptidoglycan-N-acetylmuramic acid deacetylase n=1 Tax=Fontibacillus phaseoli TaxID=1416533 RepID=A0A369B562_9BACL|nr:delta-lactam-biosynthetic de-N-acetylase [Fontibacillus phaseoli]RCX16660.1 peptidoglycan-N-acetylmuramic acid deacetylase [Fontibacillus phaseoli]
MKVAWISGLLACFLFSPVNAGEALASTPATAAVAAASTSAVSADVPYHFGFKRSVGGQLPSINEEGFKEIVDKHGAIFLGDTSRKDLFLTFDNGYENGYTSPILDTLKAKKVPAVFFITGHYVKDQPDLVKRMAAEGHLVGNHSWSHPDMTTITDTRIKEELDRVKQASAQLTGTDRMRYLRPPRGIFSDRVLRVTKELGYTNVFWSVAYKDWDVNDQKGTAYAYQKVVQQLHPGAVILLHSVSKDNAAALGAIIDEARRQGYEFRNLDELGKRPQEQQS